MSPHVCQWCILAHTCGTPGLNSAIQCVEECLWYKNLCLCNLLLCGGSVSVIDGHSCVAHYQATSIDFDAGLGKTFKHDFVLEERGAECGFRWVVDAGDEEVNCFFSL
jgi:hypothetical protein